MDQRKIALRNLIVSSLQKHSSKKITGSDKSIFIWCPFHKEVNNPSLSVCIELNKKLGIFHCLGCGISGSWNKLAEKLNLPLIHNKKQKLTLESLHHLDEKIEIPIFEEEERHFRIRKTVFTLDQLHSWPEKMSWRGFKGESLLKFKAYYNVKNPVWPLIFTYKSKVDDYPKGLIVCRREKGKPSYLFTENKSDENNWIKDSLWPVNYLTGTLKKIILVEGLRDALILNLNGLPALCLLGTNSGFNKKRISILLGLDVKEVFIFTDGDTAGEKCVQEIGPLLEQYFNVIVYPTWKYHPDEDPYSLCRNEFFLDSLKKIFNENNN